MSIYFIQLFKEILCIGVFGGIFSKNLKLRNVLISFFIGFIYSYIAFYIAKKHLKMEQVYFAANVIVVFCFVLSFVFLFKKKGLNIAKYILFVLFSFAYFIRYFYISSNYPIFSTSFLDNETIFSFAFIVLAFLFVLSLFFMIAFIKKYNEKIIIIFNIAFILMCINIMLGNILLYFDRYGYTSSILENFFGNNETLKSSIDSNLITYIAKTEDFFNKNFVYILLVLILMLGFNAVRKKIKSPIKLGLLDIEYRKNIYHNDTISKVVASLIGVVACSLCLNIYYDAVESKPIELSPAVTPTEEDGYFVFNIEEFRDNDLHRYAYISPSGKRIRFFIINKFEDKDSPSVVFDACSICGDKGYILKNNEIICVACGVRVFKPSVGKRDGCNPIPVENFEVKNGKIYVPVSQIIAGESFFSEIVEVEVTDPVDKSRFSVSSAANECSYYGITYYFKTEENYKEFMKNPEKYIPEDKRGRFIISDNNKGLENDW